MRDAARTTFYLLFVFHLANVLVVHTESDQGEDTRVDFPAQCTDIRQAFNMSKIFWLHGFNFNSSHSVTRKCIFLKVSDLNNETMNYSSNFIKDNKTGSFQYYGRFYSSNSTDDDGEEQPQVVPDSVTVHTNQCVPDALPDMNYTLLYSDYKACLILAITGVANRTNCTSEERRTTAEQVALQERDLDEDTQVTEKKKDYLCMVLLTNDTITTGMPPSCGEFYNYTCGNKPFYPIFNNTCDRNVTGQSG
ncbi:uncharacterized protein LOC142563833 [Dermacentor variabilis]|uniref:uncharacterized protein LOC142563833 n=1 Tax=Dermacentor variabilis TaxID=34621 RepID=UPI003F5C1AA3